MISTPVTKWPFNELRRWVRLLWLSVLFIVLAGTAYSQDLVRLSDQVNSGNTEQKRTALAEIRGLGSVEASRIAVRSIMDPDEIVRATAIASVVILPEAVSVISPLLGDRSEFIRREAALALGETRSEAAAQPLVTLLDRERSTLVRAAATAALGLVGSESALTTLTAVLKKGPSASTEFIRRSAARSIGQIAEKSRAGAVSRTTPSDFLPDKFKVSLQARAGGLGAFREPLAIVLRVAANRRETSDTRREAAFALGTIGDPSAVPLLTANLKDADVYLAQISREALLKIPSQK